MRRDTLLFILGLLVFLTPFFGVPQSWKTLLLFIVGSLIAILALVYRFEVRRQVRAHSIDSSFLEHDPEQTF